MAYADSFDTRDPLRPPPFLALLPLLALLWAATAHGDEPKAPPPAKPEDAAASDDDRQGLLKRKARAVFADDRLLDDADAESEGGGLHWGPLYPSLAVLSSGAGIGPMVEFWKRDLGGLDVHGAAAYSMRQYAHYSLRLGRLPHRGSGPPSFSTSSDRFFPLLNIERLSGIESRFDLYAGYRHRDYPEEDFYGVGPATHPDDRTDYRLRDHFFEAVATYHFSPRFALTAQAGLLETSLGTGRDDAFPDISLRHINASAPGLRNPPDEFILTAGALMDVRDEPGNPHRGVLLMGTLSRFEDRHGGPYDFTRAAGDLRVYLPLGSHRHVLAGRSVVSFDRPDAGDQVPFYLQSSLGGSQVLRGYPAFRFRDHKVMAFSAEYRFELVEKVELAAFYDAGEVGARRSDLRFSDLRTGWGMGVRVKAPRKVLFRFDVARSREATRYLVKLGPSF